MKFSPFAIAGAALLAAAAHAAVSVKSPDGKIEFIAAPDADGHLAYTITAGGKAVMEESQLGITVAGVDLGAGAALGEAARGSLDETYPMRGNKPTAVNRCDTAAIAVTTGAQGWTLEVRAYDDGVGFRYVVPGPSGRVVNGEATRFKFPAATKVWWQEMMRPGSRYEKPYTATDISAFAVNAVPACMLTAELPGGGYAFLTEADVIDQPGMYFTYRGNRSLQSTFVETWTSAGAVVSSWRALLIAPDLNALVNSDFIQNLCPPAAPGLFAQDWIKGGMAVWNWVENKAITPENMKRYSRLAGQLGFQYNTVDAGWESWGNAWTAMKELADYSKTVNVKIIAWKRWTQMDTQEKRKTFFSQLNQAGVVGIKVDGIDSEGVVVNKFLTASLKDAVDYKIMILWHGCPKPTGINRTWPNEIGREAIRGMENKPPFAPGNTIFPFTRLIAGPADFTPLVLNLATRRGETSWAHQIGTVVSYTAPLQNLAGDPQTIVDNPASAFIKSIPTEWDETRVLPQSKIGDLLAFARRRGNAWFVTLLNGDVANGKKLALSLSFLGGGTWDAAIVKDDAAKADAVVQETSKVTSSGSFSVDLRAGGGWVGRFVNPDIVSLRRPAPVRFRSGSPAALRSASGRALEAVGATGIYYAAPAAISGE
jgi:alpha-glucosidase